MNHRLYKAFSIVLGLLLVNLLLFTACKKDTTTYEISGQIYDPQLKINVSNVHVSLKASKIQSGVYNPSYIEIQSINTTSDGTYSFTVEHENVAGYRLDFTKEKYFESSLDIKTVDVQNNGNTGMRLDFIPIAEIKLIVKNTSPQASNDKIQFRFSNVSVKGKDCWTNTPIIGVGPNYTYSKTGQVTGNKKLFLEWTVTKNGNQHIYKDTIESEAFKMISYNINY